jgi:hypothetical protein
VTGAVLHKLLLCIGQCSTSVKGSVVGVSVSSFRMYVVCASAMVCTVHESSLPPCWFSTSGSFHIYHFAENLGGLQANWQHP